MRGDLASLVPGRAAAMASHATNAFMKKCGNRNDVRKWAASTPQGFGTAIVLRVDEDTLLDICDGNDKFPAELIVDPDYRIVVSEEIFSLIGSGKIKSFTRLDTPDQISISREETTCGYIFGDKEELEETLGTLPLY
jgi:hypothetical protein